MYKTVLIILSHMFAFSAGQLPLIMLAFYKKLNYRYVHSYQSILRIITISVVLIIVSVYKMVYIAIYNQQIIPSINTNISLFFAIAFIACVFLSIYFIIDRAIVHFSSKIRRFILNLSAGITVFLAIFTIFQLVSQSQENQLNYIDLAINWIYPILTGLLSLYGIISLVFYKKSSRNQRTYSIIFILGIPFIILDILFTEKLNFMLTSLPYIAYIIAVFYEVFSSAADQIKPPQTKNSVIKKQYQLTDREMDVYLLAAQGLSNQEISKQLFVSVHTIKTHLQHIFSKLNVSTRYQLMQFEKENAQDKEQ
ncbi:MAG: helix-turn-helix transcriptional regulator [Eubacteriales bacterium]